MNNINSKMFVLIADDDFGLCSIEKMVIDSTPNMQCCGIVHDGKAVIEAVKNLSPDLILLDQDMPLLDGIGVLEQLHKQQGEKPFVVMTSANASNILVSEAINAGADLCFKKPYDINEIIKRFSFFINSNNSTKKIDASIRSFVMNCGIKINSIAYGYICSAITYVLSDNSKKPVFKEIYSKIADENNSDVHCVENAIRHALKMANEANYPELQKLKSISNISDTEQLSSSKFFMYAADYFRYN